MVVLITRASSTPSASKCPASLIIPRNITINKCNPLVTRFENTFPGEEEQTAGSCVGVSAIFYKQGEQHV